MDVVFREVRFPPKQKSQPKEELNNIEFELESDEYESIEKDELEEEETQVPSFRRLVRETRKLKWYIPLDFHFNFYFSITYDDPISIREELDSKYTKLWNKAMVEEKDIWDKNKNWD